MMKPAKHRDAAQAMEALRPVLNEVSRMVMTCPIAEAERAALSVYVLGHFAGVACAALKVDPDADLDDVLRLVSEAAAAARRRRAQ